MTERTSGWRKLSAAPAVRTNPASSAGSNASAGSPSSPPREDDRQLARLLRSGDQQRGAGRLGQSLDSLPERSPQSVGHRQRLGSSAWPASCASESPAGSSSNAKRVTRRLVEQPAAHRWSRLPRHLVEQHRGHVPLEPTELELSRPAFEAPCSSPSRAPNKITTSSATSRRAVKDSAFADGMSNHCASSTKQKIGFGSAAAASSERTPAETRSRSRPSPGARPSAAASASRCASGNAAERVHHRAQQAMQPAKGEVGFPFDTGGPEAPSCRSPARRRTPVERSCPFPPRPGRPRIDSVRSADPRAADRSTHTPVLARQEETMGAIRAKGSSTDGSAFDRACEKCFYGWWWREATVQRGTRKAGDPTPGMSRDARTLPPIERAEFNARPAARGAAEAADHVSADRGRRVLRLRRPGRSDGIRNAHGAYHYGPEKLIIGKFCALGEGVRFIMNGANHRMDGPSTFPFPIMGVAWAGTSILSPTYPDAATPRSATTSGSDTESR